MAPQGRKRRAQPEDDEVSSPEPATQRRRASPPADDSAEVSENDEAYGSDGGTQGATPIGQMVKKMVRLALACEYQRRPIRRTEISEKVLGEGAGRRFKDVFGEAQTELRRVFGMEMVELPARDKVTLAQRRAAQKSAAASQNKATTTSWVLKSVLPLVYRDPEIMGPAAVPTQEEEAKYTGIYTLLVSLISLQGGSLPDAKLERYLTRVNMQDNTPLDGFERTDKLVKRLEKDGYIVRIKESTGTGDEDVYWTVGPRGKVEIGDEGVKGLVRTVYGELEEDMEEDLERRVGRSLGLSERPPQRRPEEEQAKRRGRPRRGEVEEEPENDEDDDEEDDED